jgi:hypothetical protein
MFIKTKQKRQEAHRSNSATPSIPELLNFKLYFLFFNLQQPAIVNYNQQHLKSTKDRSV